MCASAVIVCFLFVCGTVLSEPLSQNVSLLDSIEGVGNKLKDQLATRLANLTDAVEHKWDIVHDIMEGDLNNETEHKDEGIDSTGCDRTLRKHYEDRCDEVYEKVNDEAQAIEDDDDRLEAVCCALEDFEKCSLRAYDQANCVTDQEAIRENLKAARLFLTVISGISCNEFRGKCAYYTSSSATGYAVYGTVFASILVQLARRLS